MNAREHALQVRCLHALSRVARGRLHYYESRAYVIVFFFQAEDGIRDYKVTGVQTCALPICMAPTGAVPEGLAEYRHEWMEKGFHNQTAAPFVSDPASSIHDAKNEERRE